jgi:hypothetical protein
LRTDWANLARYREANAKLGPPAGGENRVVFYGNSIMTSDIACVVQQSRRYCDGCVSDHPRRDDTAKSMRCLPPVQLRYREAKRPQRC